MAKILIIDDDNFICGILSKHLQNNKYQTEVAYSAGGALDTLKSNKFDLVLCDFRLPDGSGLEILQKIKLLNPDLPVVIMTAYADVAMAVKLIKMGAADYITKPIQHEELMVLISSLLVKETAEGKEHKEHTNLTKNSYTNGDFVYGESNQIKHVIELARTVAPTDMSVIIEGETGTGKEYIARFIHENSARKDKPFIAIDCGAIPKDLANSELFGHVKGSFTGAIYDKEGVFQKADGGTLFLDEIANLSYEIQLKFLRAIQERLVSRVGDVKSRRVNIRVIAASNEKIQNEVRENRFREDLFHRLNEFAILLPPLRNRPDDILIFISHFIDMANQELNKNVLDLNPDVRKIFLEYPWPGNLRELKNIIKRAVLMTKGDLIEKHSLPNEIIFSDSRIDFPVASGEVKSDSLLKNASSELERQLIIKTIQESGFNKSRAAKILNIDRKTLYNKMKLYNINM